ncbi:MAG: D-alanyl-D-alanine carboxypeptidase [Rhodobacteraceae bacterium]|nr:MAG: D-alanyl-D-alanine carboxypeptidase [Paracoccaceae bacterium]
MFWISCCLMYEHEIKNFKYPVSQLKHRFFFVALAIGYLLSSPTSALSYQFATFVMDANSGKELYSQNARTKLHPASLTKMMTLYLTFNEVENGNLRLDQRVSISRNATREPPSKFGYKIGQKVSIRFLIRAAAIRSANDAATALGEVISGSEVEFAKYMTRTARAMGMKSTSFRNANGLTASGHLSTAHDMAILGQRLLYDFPEYFHLFGRSSVVSLGRTLYNTNRKFLASYSGADGIKTGFTSAAGYNLAASAKRGDKRVIAVVFGSGSVRLRTKRMTELLDIGFAKSKNFTGTKTLSAINLTQIKNNTKLASGAVFISSPPPSRPIKVSNNAIVDVKKINEMIEGILTSDAVGNIFLKENQNTPLRRPETLTLGGNDNHFGSNKENMESILLEVLETADVNRSFSILVGAYFTDFNAKKDLARLALTDLDTLGGTDRSITTGTVDQKKVFRVTFTGLKKSDALKACQRLIARNELCEIAEQTN